MGPLDWVFCFPSLSLHPGVNKPPPHSWNTAQPVFGAPQKWILVRLLPEESDGREGRGAVWGGGGQKNRGPGDVFE